MDATYPLRVHITDFLKMTHSNNSEMTKWLGEQFMLYGH